MLKMKKKAKSEIEKEIHDYMLRDLDKDLPKEESRAFKYIKRSIWALSSLFLAMLIISYLIPGHRVLSIINARFSSYEIDSLKITLKNGEAILFTGNSYNDLVNIYYHNQQHEFKACLIGQKRGNDYIVDSINIPKIYSQDFSSVRAELCGRDAIISLHSHPFKSCFLSLHDVRGHGLVKNINKDALTGIMCEVDRFNFYGFEWAN
jgi:hypothetical protein